MDGVDTSGLLPPDVVAALASFPRRFAGATDADRLADGDLARRDELAQRHGQDGTSAQNHLRDAVRTAQLIAGAIAEVLASDSPTLHPACTDPARREWPAPPGESTTGLLQELDEALHDLRSRLEGLPAHSWTRLGVVAGAGDQTLLRLASGLVATVADDLRWIERNLRPQPT